MKAVKHIRLDSKLAEMLIELSNKEKITQISIIENALSDYFKKIELLSKMNFVVTTNEQKI